MRTFAGDRERKSRDLTLQHDGGLGFSPIRSAAAPTLLGRSGARRYASIFPRRLRWLKRN
jgi:hypothetical protein